MRCLVLHLILIYKMPIKLEIDFNVFTFSFLKGHTHVLHHYCIIIIWGDEARGKNYFFVGDWVYQIIFKCYVPTFSFAKWKKISQHYCIGITKPHPPKPSMQPPVPSAHDSGEVNSAVPAVLTRLRESWWLGKVHF